MTLFSQKPTSTENSPPENLSHTKSAHNGSDTGGPVDAHLPSRKAPAIAWIMGAVASMGGFMFGYESGHISGIMAMSDFKKRFADQADGTFGPARSVFFISLSAFFYIIGVIIEITSCRVLVQFGIGRLVAGLGIEWLSMCAFMYLSESIPKTSRGAVIWSYQLLIRVGI
ncbi:putative hexose transporter protein [Lasiodiplodia theobromae]|uniref:Hexose transporter protein n=1 Tax=Lasiodiplodia theobromae TaxID=45133 RepID=A0A8H7MB00_9PEZI|nr:putative hexose transporter protein [Lasiodiplodia theobromae]